MWHPGAASRRRGSRLLMRGLEDGELSVSVRSWPLRPVVRTASTRLSRSRLDNVNGSFRGTAAIAYIATLVAIISKTATPRAYQAADSFVLD